MIKLRALSDHARDLLIQWEGLRLTAYKDSGGVLTIGVGHTGRDVTEGQAITRERAIELFDSDTEWARRTVQEATPENLSDNQFGALVAFCFNVGADAFRGSTVCRVANGRSPVSMRDALLMWVKVKGERLPGLVNRRTHEAELWEEA